MYGLHRRYNPFRGRRGRFRRSRYFRSTRDGESLKGHLRWLKFGTMLWSSYNTKLPYKQKDKQDIYPVRDFLAGVGYGMTRLMFNQGMEHLLQQVQRVNLLVDNLDVEEFVEAVYLADTAGDYVVWNSWYLPNVVEYLNMNKFYSEDSRLQMSDSAYMGRTGNNKYGPRPPGGGGGGGAAPRPAGAGGPGSGGVAPPSAGAGGSGSRDDYSIEYWRSHHSASSSSSSSAGGGERGGYRRRPVPPPPPTDDDYVAAADKAARKKALANKWLHLADSYSGLGKAVFQGGYLGPEIGKYREAQFKLGKSPSVAAANFARDHPLIARGYLIAKENSTPEEFEEGYNTARRVRMIDEVEPDVTFWDVNPVPGPRRWHVMGHNQNIYEGTWDTHPPPGPREFHVSEAQAAQNEEEKRLRARGFVPDREESSSKRGRPSPAPPSVTNPALGPPTLYQQPWEEERDRIAQINAAREAAAARQRELDERNYQADIARRNQSLRNAALEHERRLDTAERMEAKELAAQAAYVDRQPVTGIPESMHVPSDAEMSRITGLPSGALPPPKRPAPKRAEYAMKRPRLHVYSSVGHNSYVPAHLRAPAAGPVPPGPAGPVVPAGPAAPALGPPALYADDPNEYDTMLLPPPGPPRPRFGPARLYGPVPPLHLGRRRRVPPPNALALLHHGAIVDGQRAHYYLRSRKYKQD